MQILSRAVGLTALAAVTACAHAINYPSPTGPRYVGEPATPRTVERREHPNELRVVTFNDEDAVHVDSTIRLLQTAAPLAGADVIALQEMDAPATRQIADALGMYYVYYPASIARNHRDFGEAVLSRWPIIDDEKVILPHLGRIDKSQRIATGVTILVDSVPVRVYSMHLGTFVDVGAGSKRDQARAILAAADSYPRVVIAGDANSHDVGQTFQDAGYVWITRHNRSTVHWWNWDHVFARGLEPAAHADTRTGVEDARGASDHRPVWALFTFQREEPAVKERASR